ncbi:MAG: GH3 auxin-responsive promoter family protein [Clostridiaceae bacterium]|nr:GH3 auxin-responsive promoter family protein [Clostridiaceae bacterium]
MIEKLYCYLVNSLCCALYRREYRKYINNESIGEVQKEKLFKIIKDNSETDYGLKYGFKDIKTVEEFQEKVPFTDYEDYLPYIEEIKKGKKNILTSEDVLLLEKTSGSVSSSKLIPYTDSLKREFQCGIKPWVYNLYTSIPRVKWGKSYWSVTPIETEKEYTEGGIPIGFEEDSEYFGKIEKLLMNKIFVTPKDIAKESDIESFQFKTMQALLKCKNLTLISIWNPTFFLLLLEYLDGNSENLLLSLKKSRREEIFQYIKAKEYTKIWPNLKVISCWMDGNAKVYGERLQEVFNGVIIQSKGLLATEGFVSFSFTKEKGSRLSYNSHFFEFISLKDGEVYLAEELKENQRYEVVLTTSGGLYRYKIKDVIEVCGFSKETPRIIFTGRRDKVSDLFGEKLNEDFIKNMIEDLNIKKDFFMIAPEEDRYVLYLKTKEELPEIDELFRRNFHYDYCRKLGQLKKLRIFLLQGNPEKEYIDECIKRGQRMGDVKPIILSLKGGWDKVFTGHYLD